jgi:hypothetical protein
MATTATESTNTTPPAPAAAAATAVHVAELHVRINELEGYIASKFRELGDLIAKGARSVAPVVAPVVSAVEKVVDVVLKCSHGFTKGNCTTTPGCCTFGQPETPQ